MTVAPARTNSLGNAVPVGVGLLAVGAALRLFDPTRIPGVQNFLLVFASLLIEAIPFVLLGAVVSALIEVFVPQRFFERLARVPGPFQLPAAGVAGLAFPVCECGSVPVARRLAAKGLAPSAAVTFMLAAPVLNPIVIASTAVAYRGRAAMWPMVLGRAGLGLLAAMAVGWVVGGHPADDLLRTREPKVEGHSHENESRPMAFFGHVAGDFFFMGRYLVLGATVAAALQTFVPQSIVGSVAGTPFLDLVALMALAFLLSLCSESDAFVAASFVQFGVGPQLAFLVFGPMVDTKLGFLYSGTFSKGFQDRGAGGWGRDPRRHAMDRGAHRMSVRDASPSRVTRSSSVTSSRRWCTARLTDAATLGVWAGLFWYLLLAGKSALYLSSRTSWVVPLGAALLTLGAVGRFAGALAIEPKPLSRRHALGTGLIILPVIAVLALPPSALGSYAASRRSSFVGSGYLTEPEDVASGELSLADIAGALQSRGGARALARRAGSRVSLLGFVTREPGMQADEFVLTRFLVSCCVADALSVQVRVVGASPGALKTDQWVRVEGALYPLENEALVDASKVVRVERPAQPYLNP